VERHGKLAAGSCLVGGQVLTEVNEQAWGLEATDRVPRGALRANQGSIIK
jgi:hypothetical protein